MTGSGRTEGPERIGPYRILKVLGEGGMGVVYEAEQQEPVRRRVAVKMMKVGMDTVEVVRRFESERQALAVMDHPGIAKVFDAGATEDGRPYFAMELVKGIRLDEYCDQHRLTTRERAELFITVCEAVQHAHLKGVIHRDLKPSNVLVTDESGRALPKVIDFGVAKATAQKLTKDSVVTMHGQAIGTLAYMSPEQAEMGALDIDTRSDVYSLGVVLYELLLGALPLDPKEMGAWPFVAQLIQRDDPVPTPLRRLTNLAQEQREKAAQRRRTDLRRLRGELGGDLQWVVLKAMEKDRDRRYETASGLAADLQRFLVYEPVVAHPPSASYRLRKFVRRNRPVAAMAAVLMGLSLVYAISMGVQVRLVTRERDRASLEAETSQRVSDFMTELFAVSDPSEARGRSITAYEILERGAQRVETELADDPAIQQRLLSVMGNVYRTLGLYDEADTLLMAGLDAARRGSATPDSTLAQSLNLLGLLYRTQGRYDEALPLVQQAAELAAEIWGTDSREYATVQRSLGVIERGRGNFVEARAHLDTSLVVARAKLGPEHPDVGWSLYQLGWLNYREGKLKEARNLYQQVIHIFDASLDSDDPNRAMPYNDMAIVLGDLGDLDEAVAMHQRVLEIRERTLGPNHPLVAATLDNLAVVLNDMGESERALENQERALRIREQTFGHEHAEVASTLNNIGLTLQGLERYGEAAESYREAIRISESVGGPRGPGLRQPLANLGFLYRDTGHPEKARPLLQSALRLTEDALGPDHVDLTGTLVNLGFTELEAKRYESALSFMQRAVALQEKAFGDNHPRVAVAMVYVGRVHLRAGDLQQAQQVLQQALSILNESGASYAESLADACWELGKTYRALGDTAAADSLFDRSLEVTRADKGADSRDYLEAQMRYWAYMGNVGRAIELLETLIESGYRDPYVFRDPDLAGLRHDPRFASLTASIRAATEFD